MRLNPDLTRKILLVVEQNTDLSHYSTQDDFKDLLNEFSSAEIGYHLKQASDAGLIEGFKIYYSNSYAINDLTPYGHQFLNDIRNEKNWNKTKKIANTVGNLSLNALSAIAEGVTQAAIKKMFNQ